MQTVNVTQKSQEWLGIRNQHFCASDAASALGLSKFKTRTELLREKSTGIVPEIDAGKQFLFDRGNQSENIARPLVESYLQEDLSPVTGVAVIDGLPLLASFDGLNFEGSVVWENKLWSASLEAMIEVAEFTDNYWPQLEQQLLVSGAERVLFTGCDGEKIKGQLWYTSRPERRAQLIAGWKQFAKDLEGYVPQEAIPAAVAAPTMALPSVSVQVSGSIAIIDNLSVFGARLKEFVAGLNTKPEDDQAFADAEAAIKTLEKAQAALEAAESGALAQTASIDEMRRTVALYVDLARTNRLMLEKMVKARKESIRIEIQNEAKAKLAAHINECNKRLDRVKLPDIAADFAGVMKGKKLISAIRDAVDTELSQAKARATGIENHLHWNLSVYKELANGHESLFPDLGILMQKQDDDFAAVIKMRIAEQKERDAKRIEAETARIRAEEVAKLEREAAAKAALESTMKTVADTIATRESLPPSVNAVLTRDGDGLPKVAAAVTMITEAIVPPEFERLLNRLDTYVSQMTARELSDLCIHAAHLLGERGEVAA